VKGVTVQAFLRRVRAQSGFEKGVGRMQYDQKPEIGDSELTFVGIRRFRLFPIRPTLDNFRFADNPPSDIIC